MNDNDYFDDDFDDSFDDISEEWMKDVHNGKPYWFNTNTGETVHEDPYKS